MKKQTPKKLAARAKPQKIAAKPVAKVADKAAPRFNAWSLSIYVYWFIIIFFIGATFYIIGRSQEFLHPSNVEITEEALRVPREYLDAGRAKLVSGDVDGAISDLTVALDSDANLTDAYILRGEAYMQSGEYAAANDDFTKVVDADPQNSVAFYDRALLNTRTEDYSAALADINNALAAYATNPNNILSLRDIYAKRGQLNLWLKNWDGAIADYTNSLARAEGTVNVAVYAERAEAYTALGQYANAVNDYMSAVRVVSEQIQGATTVEAREDLSRKAVGYFEKSAAINVLMNNTDAARSDLESAHTIATALNDAETATRLRELILEL
jgi:tetratricopeptide (TPR) repeat protein